MPRTVTYNCPDCGGFFDFLHMTQDEPPPLYCDLCGNYMGEDAEPELSAPHIAGVMGKSGDQVYRAMEDASAARAQMAADMLGVDAGETSAMKITDMADRLRPGDVAAKLPPNSVAAAMQAQPGSFGFQPPQAALAHAMTGAAGYAGGTGNVARATVSAGHAMRAAQMTAAGRLNTKPT